MKTCAEYEELISALLDGEQSAQECEEVQAHIATCPQCRAMYDAFAAVSAVEVPELPENLHADIMNKVAAARKAMKTQRTIVRLHPMLAGAACLVVLVGTLFSVGNVFRAGSAEKAEAPSAAAPAAAESARADNGYAYIADAEGEVKMSATEAPMEPMAPAAPAAPAEPAMPAPLDSWPDESAHSELAGVLAEVVSVDDGALQVRSGSSEMFTVVLTEETEMADGLAENLVPGCVIEVAFDPARSDDAHTLYAVRILLFE